MTNYSSAPQTDIEWLQESVIDFWFSASDSTSAPATPPSARPNRSTAARGRKPLQELVARPEWFRKDPAFDQQIRDRFEAEVEDALTGHFDSWQGTPAGSLALVLLLDQFTRNMFRGSARAFAGDAHALRTAERAVSAGFDQELLPLQRSFLYLPFEHAESLTAQQTSVSLFQQLKEQTGLASPLEWAEKHAVIIARFGRFPHRNAILGRSSTAEELLFLKEPGSSF